MQIKFSRTSKPSGTAVMPCFSDRRADHDLTVFSPGEKEIVEALLNDAKKFTAGVGETILIRLSGKKNYGQVILLGLGKAAEADALTAETAGGKLFAALEGAKTGHADVLLSKVKNGKKLSTVELIARLAFGLKLRSYRFERFKSRPKDSIRLETVGFISDAPKDTEKMFGALDPVAQGVFAARDFVNDPPNSLYPEKFAAMVEEQLSPLGVKVEILDDKKLEKLGMGGISAVGMGSVRKPRMVIMHWNGQAKGAKASSAKSGPLALVGKGVTFDSGGISIKPGPGMEDMTMDMAGAAAVVGTIKSLALRKAKANVVGIIGLAENMPAGNAYRPGDIIKTYAGKTIHILNTDAEGRLILADALTYVQKTYSPSAIIDLATLTGAMMVALGHEYCGTFVNDNPLWKQLEQASAESGERLWRMPLDKKWREEMEGTLADLQNTAKSGRNAGACTAAGFLEHFIENGTPWAHLDIAGTAWIKSDLPTVPRHGTGFGVRLLDALVAAHYEKA